MSNLSTAQNGNANSTVTHQNTNFTIRQNQLHELNNGVSPAALALTPAITGAGTATAAGNRKSVKLVYCPDPVNSDTESASKHIPTTSS